MKLLIEILMVACLLALLITAIVNGSTITNDDCKIERVGE